MPLCRTQDDDDIRPKARLQFVCAGKGINADKGPTIGYRHDQTDDADHTKDCSRVHMDEITQCYA